LSGIGNKISIGGIYDHHWSSDGERLFVTLAPVESPVHKTVPVKVDIWSYRDPELQSLQLYNLDHPGSRRQSSRIYIATINLNHPQITRLNKEDEYFFFIDNRMDSFGLIKSDPDMRGESGWNKVASDYSYFLLSTRDGIRRKVRYQFSNLSTGRKYSTNDAIVGEQMFAYDLASGKAVNLTREIPEKIPFSR